MFEQISERYHKFMKEETKENSALRFTTLILIVVVYGVYAMHKYGTSNGLFITALSWSFFIFCTPIADAGFLVAFPTRILFKIRMIYTQLAAYLVAIIFVAVAFVRYTKLFSKTILLKLFYAILTTPYYWIILILSFVGTILSIYFGDELLDVAKFSQAKKFQKHVSKYNLLATATIILLTIIIYDFLIKSMGINIPLF